MKQTNKIKAFLTVLATTTALSSGFAVTWGKLTPEQRKDIIESHGSSNPFGLWNEDTMTLDDFKTKLEQKLGALSDDDLRTILQGLGYASERDKDQSHKTKMREFFTGKLTENEMADLNAYLDDKKQESVSNAPQPQQAEVTQPLVPGSLQPQQAEVTQPLVPGSFQPQQKLVEALQPQQATLGYVPQVQQGESSLRGERSSEVFQKQTPTSTPAKENPIAKAYREAAERKQAADLAKAKQASNPAPTSTQAKENPIAKAYREAAERKQAADLAKANQASNPAPTSTPAKENPIAKAYREAAERKQAVDSEKAKQASTTPAAAPIQANDQAANAKRAMIETEFNNAMYWIGETSKEELQKYQLGDLVGHIRNETQTEMSLQDIEKHALEFITRYDKSAAEIAKMPPKEKSKLQNTYLGAQRLLERLKEQKQKEEQKQEALESESEEQQDPFF